MYYSISYFRDTFSPCVWFSLTCSQGVEEEEELANSGADVERVEGLLQPIQLRQSGDQLQDVVLQILHRIMSVNLFFCFSCELYWKPLFSYCWKNLNKTWTETFVVIIGKAYRLSEVALSCYIIQTQTYTGLMQPDWIQREQKWETFSDIYSLS